MIENRFNDFFNAYTFLENHEMVKAKIKMSSTSKWYTVNRFLECIYLSVVKINPETNMLETKLDKQYLNTKTQIWLEFGGWSEEENAPCHDVRLDCGGDTFEEAIISLANLVNHYYDEKTGKEK